MIVDPPPSGMIMVTDSMVIFCTPCPIDNMDRTQDTTAPFLIIGHLYLTIFELKKGINLF